MAKSVRGDGQIDCTHSPYWYIEAKEAELYLLANKQNRERINHFSDLKRLYFDSEVLEIVYSFWNEK